MNHSLYTITLPSQTAQLIACFQKQSPSFLSSFYLSGGTALSLHLGHRESEDLDFFNQASFNPYKLEREIIRYGTLSQTELAEGTLNTFLNSVKLQFLEYPYPLLEPTINWKGIKLSSIIDIACTKLQTISMRGSKKDFVDLYFLLKEYSLADLIAATEKKYILSDYSQTHIIKSLVYFTDANEQPMPRMHTKADWTEIKNSLVKAVKSLSL